MHEPSRERPLLVFDGDCSFCRAWVEYWKQLSGERIVYSPFQLVQEQFPEISREEFARSAKLILPSGEIRSGAFAVFSVLALADQKSWMLWAYEHVPGIAAITEAGYRMIAGHRSFLYHVTKWLWGIPIEMQTYRVCSWIFLRLLGLIYLIAFLSFGVQAAGLIGSHGILPVADFLRQARQYLGAASYQNVPTIFWLNSSDAFIRGIWIAGACCSLLLAGGLNWRVLRIAPFVLYLSLVSAGQVFMTYQWDALLLEAGFLAIFLGSSVTVVRLFRWLLFRLMFLSGAVKLLSHDPAWRSFTALPVHYETQPLPTPLAWYFFQLPGWFQRASVGFVFFVELLVPILVFAPRRVRFFAGRAILALQLLIFITGNYAFFNLLAMALCIFLLDDAAVSRVLPGRLLERIRTDEKPKSRVGAGFVAALAIFVLTISSLEIASEFSGFHWAPTEAVIRFIAPFEIINTYGLFAVMTTTRAEIIIEGSNDGMTWLPYEFKYKPGELSRRPTWVEPHQPRLDWQMWFAALGNYQSDPWILNFMERLLESSPDVLRLLRRNPFPHGPPRFVRAMLYIYRFTTPAERKASGDWWHRELKETYVPAVTIRNQ